MPQTPPCESPCLTLNCHKRYLLNLGAGGKLTFSVSDTCGGGFLLVFFLKHICGGSATVWLRAVTKETGFSRDCSFVPKANLCVGHTADPHNL